METPKTISDLCPAKDPQGPCPVHTETKLLHYYRCRECLSVVTTREAIVRVRVPIPGAPPPAVTTREVRFSRCDCVPEGGQFEYMGRVEQQKERLVIDGLQAPCDGRCTNAPGPLCDCRCRGENHGTQRLVEVVTDAGPVPRLKSPCPARATEYHEAVENLKRVAGENGFAHSFAVTKALGKATKARTHVGRITALRDGEDRVRAMARVAAPRST